MSNTIDIRTMNDGKVSVIRFADKERETCTATNLKLLTSGCVAIEEDDGDGDDVRINSLEHAQNLILSLEKAIELGWFE